ncbi:universal stress protein [Sphingomonas oligophenolica]
MLTAGPMMFPALAPYTSLYLPEIALRDDGEAELSRVRAQVAAAADRVNVWGFHDSIGWLAADVRDSRQIADLIVIGASDAWLHGWLRRRMIETLVLSAGTPLLLLPPSGWSGKVGHAMLGWKPSAHANRVVHDLVALAEPGARIDIVTIGRAVEPEPDSVVPGSGIVRHLTRHGFAVELHRLDEDGVEADQLSAFAIDRGADLLAVGGFAHSRVRDIVLGGVTQGLIEKTELPVLMAH